MQTLRFTILTAALAMLASCGSSQTMLQMGGPQAQVHQSDKSWMAPGTSGNTLLYVALPHAHAVNVYSFPDLELVGQLNNIGFPWTLCSDNQGNVWVANDAPYSSTIMEEYAHGGTKPIRRLHDPKGEAQACAIDPTTGNLAVANVWYYREGFVEIFAGARGKAREYLPYDVWDPNSATYDSHGDLFIAGQIGPYAAGTDWLSQGSSNFEKFRLKKPHTYPHIGVVCNGMSLTAIADSRRIHQYDVQGSKAKYVGSLTLDVPTIWTVIISGSTLVASDLKSNVYIFDYPDGGEPVSTISDLYGPAGVAISVAPSHPRATEDYARNKADGSRRTVRSFSGLGLAF